MSSALRSVPRSAVTERELIAAVRHGDDRAFEVLYAGYRARVQAYVTGMVGCHARAEDVTQEVFISALRRMRETDGEISFRPWIFEIARNACIDQARRTKRRPEVLVALGQPGASGEAEAGSTFTAVAPLEATPEAVMQRRQQLRDLCGAFGGLSDAHHRILVMRELEGRSYREIGDELGMSRTIIESMLFRARRKLTEEYDEIASGRRCEQVRALIDVGTQGHPRRGRLGVRDRRRLELHLTQCDPCRRHARRVGLGEPDSPRPSVAARVAALLPLPVIGFGRLGRFGKAAGSRRLPVPVPQQLGAIGSIAPAAEGTLAGVSRAAAVAAIALAGAGGGFAVRSGGLGAPSRSGMAAKHAGGTGVARARGPAAASVSVRKVAIDQGAVLVGGTWRVPGDSVPPRVLAIWSAASPASLPPGGAGTSGGEGTPGALVRDPHGGGGGAGVAPSLPQLPGAGAHPYAGAPTAGAVPDVTSAVPHAQQPSGPALHPPSSYPAPPALPTVTPPSSPPSTSSVGPLGTTNGAVASASSTVTGTGGPTSSATSAAAGTVVKAASTAANGAPTVGGTAPQPTATSATSGSSSAAVTSASGAIAGVAGSAAGGRSGSSIPPYAGG